ncbi:MAG: hypothetical protein PW792_08005 [Acidobacteriaceae bacterium]|nr:hypothetical protein [Acidobacteriaceae bacterium]
MPKQPAHTPPPTNNVPETVDPMWLLTAAAVVVIVAMVCGYAAMCGLYYRGQWQIVLHPLHTERHQPDEYGLQPEAVRFGSDSTGQPQLHGWWFASDARNAPAVLMLPSGDGSAGDLLARAKLFHDLRLNVLLFDYRGAGESLGNHPSQHTMRQDAAAALAFLDSRGVSEAQTLVYAKGVGASLAVELCQQHATLPALILEAVDGDFATRARLDPRSRIVPFRALFHEDFPLATPLHKLQTPKLLIASTEGAPPAVYQQASAPKMQLELPSNAPEQDLQTGIHRFLGMYVALPPATLQP